MFASARKPDSLDSLEERGIHTLQLDVTSSTSIKEAVQHVVEKAGRCVGGRVKGVGGCGPVCSKYVCARTHACLHVCIRLCMVAITARGFITLIIITLILQDRRAGEQCGLQCTRPHR